ncbi:MAG: hypothetical protein EXQ53_06530 [Acidobacteria bacterium]|nr:hypothetical protein [Acidobacteriota bacterium]
MKSVAVWLLVLGSCWPAVSEAQRAAVRRPAASARAAPPAPITEAAVVACPSMLGDGARTKRVFCDVLTGRDPAAGIIVALPPHAGPVTLTFDLHNRHTYSEELIKTGRAYRHYTATIGVLTANNTLLTRAVVQNEFRTAADVVDRVTGGAGPGGVKAVAPTGTEPITVTIPETEPTVSILGERLTVISVDGTDNFSAPGRPVAIISNVRVEYQPPLPVRRAPARRR